MDLAKSQALAGDFGQGIDRAVVEAALLQVGRRWQQNVIKLVSFVDLHRKADHEIDRLVPVDDGADLAPTTHHLIAAAVDQHFYLVIDAPALGVPVRLRDERAGVRRQRK